MFLKTVTGRSMKTKEKDKKQRNTPFSSQWSKFPRTLLVDERRPLCILHMSGKGKEPAKNSTKETEKPGEYIGEV